MTLGSHLLPGTGCSSARAARGCSCAWRRARRSTCHCYWPSSRHDSRVALAARYRLQQRACSQGLFLRLEASAVLDVQELRGPLGRRELRFTALESQQFKVRGGL